MTSINPVHACLPRRADAPVAHRAPEPRTQTFTRRINDTGAAVAPKDKALISPAALARELDAMFPTPGHRYFQYRNMPAIVQRSLDGKLQVCDTNDRFVEIENGVITDEKVHQGDILSFLTAAKTAH